MWSALPEVIPLLHRMNNQVVRLLQSKNDRHWMSALSTSTFVHISLILILGWWWSPPMLEKPTYQVNSRWAAIEGPPVVVELPPPTAPELTESGGATQQSVFPSSGGGDRAALIPVPAAESRFSLDAFARIYADADLGQAIGDLAGGTGDGQSSGNDEGKGHGAGFFGTRVIGDSIVYVVDCSRSMNHPHPSEAKTRFRRLKMELVRSIGTMTPQQQFFIIFFNNEAIPMPAAGMQPAIPAAQSRFLEWAAKMHAFGQPTDPRKAISLALRLKPDVIYLLTDGSFAKECERDLLALKQSGTRIDTFAFGERAGEVIMAKIAENNGGQYQFVP